MPHLRRRALLGCVAVAFAAFIVGPLLSNAHAAGSPKQVLVLSSTRHDEQFSVVSEREMPKLLTEGLAEDVDYYTEYLDRLRFPPEMFEPAYVDFLRRKYEAMRFDLLMPMGDVAIDFVRRHRDVLFVGTPVVFYTFNPPSSRMTNATGVINEFRFSRSIDLALALQPDLEHIFVVSGTGDSDRRFERQVKDEFRPFERRVQFTYLSGLATNDLESRLRTLPPRSAVYYLLVSRDGAGEHFQQMAYVARVASAANAPTYSWADAVVDSGILAGSRRDQMAELKGIAALALRVLRGERADDIPVMAANMDVDKVDWRQLRRWGIREARVPAGTTILFREPSVWERYKGYIVSSLMLLLAQTALIAALLTQRSMRRRADRQLRASQDELRASYDRIRYLGHRLLGIQEAERAFVARELHDDINQQLALLSIELDSLGSDDVQVDGAERLSRALERTHIISKSVHELSHRLHPSVLRLVGLVAALERLQRDFSQAAQSVTFSHRDVPRSIEHDLALCLFRVAQEALRNAAKHSDAAYVWMDLTGKTNELVLTIGDDGKGFDIARVPSDRLGLASMRERVEAVGGWLEIHSTAAAGTLVKATVPVRTVPAAV